MKTEIWECKDCDIDAPCRIEIKYSDAKLPEHLKGNERFRDKRCFCTETSFPDWRRLDNVNADDLVVKLMEVLENIANPANSRDMHDMATMAEVALEEAKALTPSPAPRQV